MIDNDPFAMVAQIAKDSNRRTRLDRNLDPELKGWLHRVARTHAGLCATVRRFGDPRKAGGAGLVGDDYRQRLERGDRSILADSVALAIDELAGVRDEILDRMDQAPATSANPGSLAKIRAMTRRAERGESLFIRGDRGVPVVPE